MPATTKSSILAIAATCVAFPAFSQETIVGVAQVVNTSRQSGTLTGLLIVLAVLATVVCLAMVLKSRRVNAARRKLNENKSRIAYVVDTRNGLPTRPM